MGTEKGRKQESCEQGTVQRQDPASHPHLGLQLPGSGTHPSTRLLRTLTSSTGGKGSLPGKAVLDFTGCNIQKTPQACILRDRTSASESAPAATIQLLSYKSPPGATTSVHDLQMLVLVLGPALHAAVSASHFHLSCSATRPLQGETQPGPGFPSSQVEGGRNSSVTCILLNAVSHGEKRPGNAPALQAQPSLVLPSQDMLTVDTSASPQALQLDKRANWGEQKRGKSPLCELLTLQIEIPNNSMLKALKQILGALCTCVRLNQKSSSAAMGSP